MSIDRQRLACGAGVILLLLMLSPGLRGVSAGLLPPATAATGETMAAAVVTDPRGPSSPEPASLSPGAQVARAQSARPLAGAPAPPQGRVSSLAPASGHGDGAGPAAVAHPWARITDRESVAVWLRLASLDQKSQLALYDSLPSPEPGLLITESGSIMTLEGTDLTDARVFWLSQRRGYLGEGERLGPPPDEGEIRAVVVRTGEHGSVRVSASVPR